MKIRNGFVSNSSSSSFAVFGAAMDSLPEHVLSYRDGPQEAVAKVGLVLVSNPDDMECKYIIGKSPSEMRMEQTLAEFVQQIANEINLLLKQPNEDVDEDEEDVDVPEIIYDIKFYAGTEYN
jgi:hypothetical protein